MFGRNNKFSVKERLRRLDGFEEGSKRGFNAQYFSRQGLVPKVDDRLEALEKQVKDLTDRLIMEDYEPPIEIKQNGKDWFAIVDNWTSKSANTPEAAKKLADTYLKSFKTVKVRPKPEAVEYIYSPNGMPIALSNGSGFR